MFSFRLNNGFRLQKTNRARSRWKQPPKNSFDHVSRDKILHESWSIQGFSDRHFKRGDGPGDEVDCAGLQGTMFTTSLPVAKWLEHPIRVRRVMGSISVGA